MLTNKNDIKINTRFSYLISINLLNLFIVLIILALKTSIVTSNNNQLPQKIFYIQKSYEQIPIIKLQSLSSQFEQISLIMDSGSSQLAIFDSQCDQCANTLSVCPHIKIPNNQTLINYLLTQFKGDYSYLTIASQIRTRFFCVLKLQGIQNTLQANGVLGVRIFHHNWLLKSLKQTNGIKIWRKIVQKIYQKDEQKQNNDQQNKIGFMRSGLRYTIFYTQYHTQLILGNISQNFTKHNLGQLNLQQQIYTNNQYYFFQNNQTNNTTLSKLVHFDSGSSVIGLPWDEFEEFFKQLNEKVNNECQLMDMQIKCNKISIKTLIELNLSFKISIFQKTQQKITNKINLEIQLQNLIQRNTKINDNQFTFKIIGYKKENDKQKDFIILGVPLFKQYLIQYDIPFSIQQKYPISQILNNTKINQNNTKSNQAYNQSYKINIYAHKFKQSNQDLSPYDHLVKKYNRNIKLFTFLYLFLVFLLSYSFIQLYWKIVSFLQGKRQLV